MTDKIKVLLGFHALVTRSNHRLTEELSHFDEIELHVLAPDWWPEEARQVHQEKIWDANYTIHQVKMWYWRKPLPNLFCYRPGLGRILREVQPDILDFYEEPYSLVMGQALLLQRLYAPRTRLLFYSAQNIYKRYPFPFSWFEQLTYRIGSAAHICNWETADVLRAKGYKGSLHYIPLGVDPAVFKPLPIAARQNVFAQLGLSNEHPVIGYLGRLHWEKGLAILLEAVAQIENVQLLLVGDGPHRSEIEQKVGTLGLTDRTYFSGAINRLDVPQYLNAMDCLVVPSLTMPNWKEQFGRIIVEAFLCQVPVIGSSCGSIPEIIGESGIVVPENDVTALRQAIMELLTDPAKNAELVVAARQRALTDFTWERVAQQRFDLYQQILDSPNPNR